MCWARDDGEVGECAFLVELDADGLCGVVDGCDASDGGADGVVADEDGLVGEGDGEFDVVSGFERECRVHGEEDAGDGDVGGVEGCKADPSRGTEFPSSHQRDALMPSAVCRLDLVHRVHLALRLEGVEESSDGIGWEIRERGGFADNFLVTTPSISIIVPTRGRAHQLDACLVCLHKQRFDGHFEVIVVLDGPDGPSAVIARRHQLLGLDVVLVKSERLGIAEAKNRGIEHARGELLLLINDDILPGEGFVAAHVRAHRSVQGARAERALVVGWSPWKVQERDSLFARALRETSMVFFYDQMITPEGVALRGRDHDWGYRHAWNLNLSLERSLAEEVGGFRPALANCCYEDVEFAYRATRAGGEVGENGLIPVFFEPEALAEHDHAYTARGYLEREWRLGYSAHGFAVAAPEAAQAVFGRDVASAEEYAFARAFVAREGGREGRFLRDFEGLEGVAPDAGGVGEAGRWAVELAYGQHLLLKRLAFMRGLIAAFDGEEREGLFHPNHGLESGPGLLSGVASTGAGEQKHRRK